VIHPGGPWCNSTKSVLTNSTTDQEKPVEKEGKTSGFMIRAFPNPVSQILHLEWENGKPGELTRIEMVNIFGEKIMAATLNDNEIEIDMSELPAGFYLLHACQGMISGTVKIVLR
jgi:hypothetical protein